MARIDFVTGNARRYVPEVEALAAISDRVEALLAGHSGDELTQAPAAGEWPPARVIGHLIADARHLHADLRCMASMSDPALQPWDEQAEVDRGNWEGEPAVHLLNELALAVVGSVETLKDLPDASWGRAGTHPRAGRISILQLARGQARHFDQHLAQLEQLLGG